MSPATDIHRYQPPVPRADFDRALDVIRSATDERQVICDLLGVDPLSDKPEDRPMWVLGQVLEDKDAAEKAAAMLGNYVVELMQAAGVDPMAEGASNRLLEVVLEMKARDERRVSQ